MRKETTIFPHQAATAAYKELGLLIKSALYEGYPLLAKGIKSVFVYQDEDNEFVITFSYNNEGEKLRLMLQLHDLFSVKLLQLHDSSGEPYIFISSACMPLSKIIPNQSNSNALAQPLPKPSDRALEGLFKILKINDTSIIQRCIKATNDAYQQYETENKSSKNNDAVPIKIYQPEKLKDIVAGYLIKNKVTFFKDLAELPESLIKQYPDLDTDPKNLFIRNVQKTISKYFQVFDATKVKNLTALESLKEIETAPNDKNPYNAVHKVIQGIDKKCKEAFLSNLKETIKPVREEVIRAMKQYNEDKKLFTENFATDNSGTNQLSS